MILLDSRLCSGCHWQGLHSQYNLFNWGCILTRHALFTFSVKTVLKSFAQ